MDHGVIVDEYLETQRAGRVRGRRYRTLARSALGERIRVEHWVVAERQGQTAARNMLGRREKFVAVPFFWTAQYDVGINYVGHATKWDRIEVDGSFDERNAAGRSIAGGTVALATIYRDRESLEFEREVELRDAR